MHTDVERILFTEEQIHGAVQTLGRKISQDYAGKKLIVVGILKGACVFMTDLIREIDADIMIDFMVAKSYGNSTVSSGNVRILKDLDTDITDMDVLIVEDILDTARTLSAVKNYLLGKSPASVKICTLLDKVGAEKVGDVRADYKCFDIENEFVVGYGLDYAERYRNLPYIGILRRSVYEY